MPGLGFREQIRLEELLMKKFVAGMSLAALMMAGTVAFAAGADDYKAKCAMCHGADGKGAMAKKMGSRDLSSADVQGMSDADIAKIVIDGKGKMTGFKGKLTDDQIKGVAAYVKTLK
jgi:cytochrome c6